MLAMSVLQALSMAVASVADHKICPRLDAPATPERVLMAVERLRAEMQAVALRQTRTIFPRWWHSVAPPSVLPDISPSRGEIGSC